MGKMQQVHYSIKNKSGLVGFCKSAEAENFGWSHNWGLLKHTLLFEAHFTNFHNEKQMSLSQQSVHTYYAKMGYERGEVMLWLLIHKWLQAL